jgi:hypothetical protein
MLTPTSARLKIQIQASKKKEESKCYTAFAYASSWRAGSRLQRHQEELRQQWLRWYLWQPQHSRKLHLHLQRHLSIRGSSACIGICSGFSSRTSRAGTCRGSSACACICGGCNSRRRSRTCSRIRSGGSTAK